MFSNRKNGYSFKFILLGLFLISTQVSAVDMVNVSTRGVAGQENKQLVVGFVVTGKGSKQIMITGAGPSTEITGAISNPEFTVYNQKTGEQVYYCDDWKNCLGSNTVQAYMDKNDQILTDSEAAAILSFKAGAYSIEIRDADGVRGIALGTAIELPNYVRSNDISYGTWQSDDASVCFNVVSSELSPRFSHCLDEASLSIDLWGKTASGEDCKISAYSKQKISLENSQFHWVGPDFSGNEIVTLSGVFFGPMKSSGSAIQNFPDAPLADACIAEWREKK